jgi:hypothetical protein
MKQLSENDSKRVAQAWAERHGESLLAEVEEMHRQGVSYQTPRADKVVRGVFSRRGETARRRRTAMFMGLAAAACLLIVVWVAGIPSLVAPPSTSPGDVMIDSSASTPEAAKIPISFDLPADYRVAASGYDDGMSIYALESAARGDVVLTMYREDGRSADAAAESGSSFAATDEVVIDGAAVWAKVDEAYMLLTFEREGVRYTLSNRDDMGALAAFYRSITGATL